MCRLIRIRLYPNKVERTEHVYEVRVRVYEMGVPECASYSVGAFETVRTTSRVCFFANFECSTSVVVKKILALHKRMNN